MSEYAIILSFFVKFKTYLLKVMYFFKFWTNGMDDNLVEFLMRIKVADNALQVCANWMWLWSDASSFILRKMRMVNQVKSSGAGRGKVCVTKANKLRNSRNPGTCLQINFQNQSEPSNKIFKITTIDHKANFRYVSMEKYVDSLKIS